MNTILRPCFLLIISVLFLTACGKPKDGDNNVDDDTALDIGDFLPTKEGSWWLYNSTLPDQFMRKATGLDTMKAGLKFKLFTYEALSDGDRDAEYFGKFDGRDYYSLLRFDTVEANFFKVIVMRDSCRVGETWVNTGKLPFTTDLLSGEVDVTVDCKIVSMTETLSIPDTTFTNVIKMEGTLKGSYGIIRDNCGSVTYYFVRGVGVVKQVFDIEIKLFGIKFFEKKHTETLQDYHIEPS